MTGSLQIKGNKYYAVLNIKDEFGKTKKKWVSTQIPVKGNNKNLAKARLNEIIAQYSYLDNIFDSNILFTDYITRWIQYEQDNKTLALNTIENYKELIDVHIVPYWKPKHIKLQDVNSYMLEQFYKDKLKNGRIDGNGGLSQGTVKGFNIILSSVFNKPMKDRLVVFNPCNTVDLPKSDIRQTPLTFLKNFKDLSSNIK